jgi:hypothetical protein
LQFLLYPSSPQHAIVVSPDKQSHWGHYNFFVVQKGSASKQIFSCLGQSQTRTNTDPTIPLTWKWTNSTVNQSEQTIQKPEKYLKISGICLLLEVTPLHHMEQSCQPRSCPKCQALQKGSKICMVVMFISKINHAYYSSFDDGFGRSCILDKISATYSWHPIGQNSLKSDENLFGCAACAS